MKAYDLMKILIKSGRKTPEDLVKYAEAYCRTGRLTEEEYQEIMDGIKNMEGKEKSNE